VGEDKRLGIRAAGRQVEQAGPRLPAAVHREIEEHWKVEEPPKDACGKDGRL